MAFLGDVLNIAHVMKRAYQLYTGCQAAPEEIHLACDHIHAMTLVLSSVDSDVIKNPRASIHQQSHIAKTRLHSLKIYIGSCERALRRMESLLKKYMGFKGNHVSLWNKFKWSTEGKKEIADCKADLVLTTSVLNMWLSKENANVLWNVESMMEIMMKKIGALEALCTPTAAQTQQRRPRSRSNVTRTIVASLVLARFRKILRTYRRKKNSSAKKPNQKPHPGPRRPKAVPRTNSGFKNNPNRNKLLHSYATNIANNSLTPPPPYTPSKPRPRTPSPNFRSGATTPSNPKPIRRSSSMQRLMGRINAITIAPKPPAERYECYKIGIGHVALGPKIAPEFKAHKRGQMQLKKMGQIFKEASEGDAKAITEKSTSIRLLLEKKNMGRKKGEGKWFFVGGRFVGRDVGKTGMISVEKAVVVLVRR